MSKRCEGCGAPPRSLTDRVCFYCGTVSPQEKEEAPLREIRANMTTYTRLEKVILKGNMNTVLEAIDCEIRGNMNTISRAVRCKIRGNMNTVLSESQS